MSQPLANITREQTRITTEGNRGGLLPWLEVMPVQEVATFPALVDGMRFTSAITFVNGGGLHIWYHTRGTGVVNSELVGNRGGQLWRNSINCTVPGTAPEVLQQVQAMLDARLIVIGRDKQGRKRVVGSKLRPATVSVRHTTGQNSSDRPGSEFTLQAFSPYVAPIYDVAGKYPVNPDGFNFNLVTSETGYTEI